MARKERRPLKPMRESAYPASADTVTTPMVKPMASTSELKVTCQMLGSVHKKDQFLRVRPPKLPSWSTGTKPYVRWENVEMRIHT